MEEQAKGQKCSFLLQKQSEESTYHQEGAILVICMCNGQVSYSRDRMTVA